MEETEDSINISPEMERMAARRANNRAKAARWDLDVAVFLFAILIIVIILLFYEYGVEIVGPIAVFGLAMAWVVGWRRGRELYRQFHEEELSTIRKEFKKAIKGAVEEAVEETIEEKVQKALRERWR